MIAKVLATCTLHKIEKKTSVSPVLAGGHVQVRWKDRRTVEEDTKRREDIHMLSWLCRRQKNPHNYKMGFFMYFHIFFYFAFLF